MRKEAAWSAINKLFKNKNRSLFIKKVKSNLKKKSEYYLTGDGRPRRIIVAHRSRHKIKRLARHIGGQITRQRPIIENSRRRTLENKIV